MSTFPPISFLHFDTDSRKQKSISYSTLPAHPSPPVDILFRRPTRFDFSSFNDGTAKLRHTFACALVFRLEAIGRELACAANHFDEVVSPGEYPENIDRRAYQVIGMPSPPNIPFINPHFHTIIHEQLPVTALVHEVERLQNLGRMAEAYKDETKRRVQEMPDTDRYWNFARNVHRIQFFIGHFRTPSLATESDVDSIDEEETILTAESTEANPVDPQVHQAFVQSVSAAAPTTIAAETIAGTGSPSFGRLFLRTYLPTVVEQQEPPSRSAQLGPLGVLGLSAFTPGFIPQFTTSVDTGAQNHSIPSNQIGPLEAPGLNPLAQEFIPQAQRDLVETHSNAYDTESPINYGASEDEGDITIDNESFCDVSAAYYAHAEGSLRQSSLPLQSFSDNGSHVYAISDALIGIDSLGKHARLEEGIKDEPFEFKPFENLRKGAQDEFVNKSRGEEQVSELKAVIHQAVKVLKKDLGRLGDRIIQNGAASTSSQNKNRHAHANYQHDGKRQRVTADQTAQLPSPGFSIHSQRARRTNGPPKHKIRSTPSSLPST